MHGPAGMPTAPPPPLPQDPQLHFKCYTTHDTPSAQLVLQMPKNVIFPKFLVNTLQH